MKAIVHIGARKTGTTTIQSVLKANVDALCARGLFMTRAYDAGADNIFPNRFLQRKDVAEKWDGWAARLKAARAAGADRALISAESLTDLATEEIALLRDLLTRSCDEVRVLFYVRRQDVVAVSHYSTGLRGGGTSDALLSTRMGSRGRRGFHYGKTADAWASVFGRAALTLRVFPDPRPEGWDALRDFLPLIGIDPADLTTPGETAANPRLSARQGAYLRQLNLRLGSKAKARGPWLQMAFLEANPDLAHGPAVPLPSRATAETFYAQFREDNEALRRTYLPELNAPLFPEGFDQYPETTSSLDDHLDSKDFEQRFATFDTHHVAEG